MSWRRIGDSIIYTKKKRTLSIRVQAAFPFTWLAEAGFQTTGTFVYLLLYVTTHPLLHVYVLVFVRRQVATVLRYRSKY